MKKDNLQDLNFKGGRVFIPAKRKYRGLDHSHPAWQETRAPLFINQFNGIMQFLKG